MNQFNPLEEQYIEHRLSKYDQRFPGLKRWHEQDRTWKQFLADVQGSTMTDFRRLNAEAERRHQIKKELKRYGAN